MALMPMAPHWVISIAAALALTLGATCGSARADGLGIKRERLDLPVVKDAHPAPPSDKH
jgi:hypothetical protein